jgi:hypothetical protein
VLLPLEPMMSAMALAGAAGAAVVATPTLKRLTRSGQASVWGWSLLSLISLVTKFGVAAAALGTVSGLTDVVTLALIVLAGMSIPIGVGGFGPREAVAAVAFAAVGLSADAGVATAAAYGMLAAVSALPGVLVMLFDLWRDGSADAADAADSADPVAAELAEIHPELIHPELIHPELLHRELVHAELVHAELVHPELVHPQPLHPVLVHQHHILGDVVQLDLVGKAKRDRLAIDAQSASRSQIAFDDVFAELEPARRSA